MKFKKLFICCFCILYITTVFAGQKPLIVVLDWFINPNHAPLFVAQQEGFFQQQGIEVQFIPPADTAEGEKMVAANQADIAISYQPTLMYKVTNGLPLVRFATIINTPLNALITLAHSTIHTIKDLKGKNIGYSTPGTDHILLTTMLKSAGLNSNDVNLINVKFNLTQALLTGKIDAFTGGMRNFEQIIMDLAKKPARMFYPEKHGFPTYDELILVTNKNKINNPDLMKFVAALQQGLDFLLKNPEICWEKFVANHPELNNTLNKKAWFLTLPYFARNPAKLDQNRYHKLANFMHKEKLITYVPDINSYTVKF